MKIATGAESVGVVYTSWIFIKLNAVSKNSTNDEIRDPNPNTFITPPPVGGRGIVFGRFLSFFVSLSATLQENCWTDLHESFREGVE